MVNAVIYAMALLQLSPRYVPGQFTPHPSGLHTKLNELFQTRPGGYAYEACDLLLKMVKDELAQRGIGWPASSRTFRLGERAKSATGRLLINTIDNNTNDPDGPLGTTRGWADRGPDR
jgi:hypothetical protein